MNSFLEIQKKKNLIELKKVIDKHEDIIHEWIMQLNKPK
jgi:hypothetical protein